MLSTVCNDCDYGRGVEYLAILVGVWVYMVAPNLYAATLSVSPFGHGMHP